ncbi:unnamed protein product [Clonostachys solani]|uniref:F-box domain-containing protein n=1 Tax=Clonostachys solani TaxID=160281 RepID=A0A9N9W620_9HYPO|nr:unnamed protein product [Clonostachys solani]
MACKIKELPTEIDLQIWSHLSLTELSMLSQCDKTINKLLNFYLLHTAIMFWGCSQRDRLLIRKALSYGADASIIEVDEADPSASTNFGLPLRDHPTKRLTRVSTLALVAESGDEVTFQFLLDHGARVDPCILSDSRWPSMSKFLLAPHRMQLLYQCIKNGLIDEMANPKESIDRLLIEPVGSSADLDESDWWAKGAIPRLSLLQNTDGRDKSAVVASVLLESISVARFLASFVPSWRNHPIEFLLRAYYGYDWLRLMLFVPPVIPKLTRTTTEWLVLIAAHQMASSGSTKMIDVLLEAQIDISKDTTEIGFPFGRRTIDALTEEWLIDPKWLTGVDAVYVYVLSVDCTKPTQPGALSASQGLEYLFQKGASLGKTLFWGPEGLSIGCIRPLYWYAWRKWDCERGLLHDEAFSMLKILLRKGAVKAMLKDCLTVCKCTRSPTQSALTLSQRQVILARWAVLLDIMTIEYSIHPHYTPGLSRMLSHLLRSIVKEALDLDLDSPEINTPHLLVARLNRGIINIRHALTIRKLIEKGANLRCTAVWGGKPESILEAVSSSFKQNLKPDTMRYKLQRSFVRGLITLGAKPLGDDEFSGGLEVDEEQCFGFVFGADPASKTLPAYEGVIPEEEIPLWTLDGVPLLCLPESCFPKRRIWELSPRCQIANLT